MSTDESTIAALTPPILSKPVKGADEARWETALRRQ